jgi:methylmalonyl-CoA mutase N-terminal domain/subunit
VANTIDPLAGSYFIETLTNEIEEATWDYINKIDAMGGMIAAIEKGFPQMEIAESAYKFQGQLERGEKIMVGMNKYLSSNEYPIPLLEIEERISEEQIKRLHDVRRKRDNTAVKKSLDNIKSACKKGKNVMPYCIEAVKNLATLQEICDIYREVYGEYRDPGLY